MVISRFLDDEWLHSKHFKTHTFPATNCCIPAFWDFSAGIFSREPFSAAWSNRETPLKHPACVTFTIWEVCSMSGQATCLFIFYRANSKISLPSKTADHINVHTPYTPSSGNLSIELGFLSEPFPATADACNKNLEDIWASAWTTAYFDMETNCG